MKALRDAALTRMRTAWDNGRGWPDYRMTCEELRKGEQVPPSVLFKSCKRDAVYLLLLRREATWREISATPGGSRFERLEIPEPGEVLQKVLDESYFKGVVAYEDLEAEQPPESRLVQALQALREQSMRSGALPSIFWHLSLEGKDRLARRKQDPNEDHGLPRSSDEEDGFGVDSGDGINEDQHHARNIEGVGSMAASRLVASVCEPQHCSDGVSTLKEPGKRAV